MFSCLKSSIKVDKNSESTALKTLDIQQQRIVIPERRETNEANSIAALTFYRQAFTEPQHREREGMQLDHSSLNELRKQKPKTTAICETEYRRGESYTNCSCLRFLFSQLIKTAMV